MAVIRLTAKREGSLLSREFSREITQDQLELVQALLLITDEGDDIDLEMLKYNFELTLTMARARQPTGGIEQYQAESR